jgi:predicted  nucleic acid-binding Zn-ribbon protein
VLRALALIALLATLASACGADDSVAVEDYANDLCTALTHWTAAIRDRQEELQQDPGTGSPEDERGALQRFVDGAADASDQLVDDVDAAGVPDIENGEEVADAFHDAVEDTLSQIEEARDSVADIPTDSESAYRSAVDQFVTDLRATLEGIDEHFQDIDAPELDKALDEASACQG